MLVNRLTAKRMNRLTAKFVDCLTAKLVVVNLVKLHLTTFIEYSMYFKEVIQYLLLSIQSGVHSIEVINNRNLSQIQFTLV